MRPGEIIGGKYRIERLIGKGAFGEVYLARHLTLNVARALKILRQDTAGLGSSDYLAGRERFQLEAQLGAHILHPNLLQVYDFEELDGTLVLAMEYAPGGSLLERMKDPEGLGLRPLALEKALRVAIEATEGLGALHDQDVVHRDLKPSNLLFGAEGRVKVGDLGLAQIPGLVISRDRTSLGLGHPGTLGYMSPEQERSRGALTPASDIFALGVVLFEMLTGRSYGVRPGTRPGELRTDIPAWLDELAVRMLAEDRNARPKDGRAAAEALRTGWESEARERERKRQEVETERQKLVREEDARRALAARQAQEEARRLAEQTQREQKAAAERLEAEAGRKAAEQKKAGEALARKRRLAEFRRQLRPWLPWVGVMMGAAALVALLAILIPGWIPPHQPAPAATTQAPTAEALLATLTPSSTARPTATDTITPQPTLPPTPTLTPTHTPEPTPTLGNGSTQVSDSDGMVMVYVPAGEFLMGSIDSDPSASADEMPQHTVILGAFWIDQIEVTNGMYTKCVSARKCSEPSEKGSSTRASYYGDPQYSAYPVIYVSWDDASAYCQWAGRRLPTEAEWEKAARGTDGRTFPWSSQAPDASMANFNGNVGETTEGGKYPAGDSPYGALDMAGNVWEWVADWYKAYPGNTASNGSYGEKYRVARGGSWDATEWYLRSALRFRGGPAYWDDLLGFRCAR